MKFKLLSSQTVNLDEAEEALQIKAEKERREDNSAAGEEEETTFNNPEVRVLVLNFE